MRTEPAGPLPDVLVIEPEVHRDHRGHFLETWREPRYRAAGVEADFVQDNLARSRAGVLRGLHFQHPHGQGKLLQAVRGAVFDVTVDVRTGSPTFGDWFGTRLDDEDRRQLWVPPGFAHGYLVLEAPADVHYKCTEVYHPEAEHTLRWDDPAVGIEWPLAEAGPDAPELSEKDAGAPTLAELEEAGALPEGGP